MKVFGGWGVAQGTVDYILVTVWVMIHIRGSSMKDSLFAIAISVELLSAFNVLLLLL